jgi:hypothetical protein
MLPNRAWCDLKVACLAVALSKLNDATRCSAIGTLMERASLVTAGCEASMTMRPHPVREVTKA